MNILEQLATTQVSEIADMIYERRVPPADDDASVQPGTVGKWDNKPTWDNWTQKPPPFTKKTVYFKKK